MSIAQPVLARLSQRLSPMVVPLIVGFALFMQMLDSTVIVTALPAMAHSFGEDPVRLNVALTAYLLSAAIFVPICGWAADRFGARRVFAAAIILFTVSSALCGMSQSLWQVVGGRVLQGFAGAMMVPVGRIVLLRSVSKAELVRAMSFLSMPALLGPIFGPAVGGFLVEYTSWRWIFFMNVPIGLVGVTLALRYIKDGEAPSAKPLDTVGFLLMAACMGALMFGFEAIGHSVLPPAGVAGLLALGALCGWLYRRHAERSPYPILDLRLFRIPTFSTSLVGGNMCRLAVGSVPFLLAMQLQVVFGMGPFAAGLLTFSSAVGALIMKVTVSPIVKRFGFRRTLVVNAFLSGGSLLGCVFFTEVTPHALIIFVLLLAGFFRSLQLTSVNSLTYADLGPGQMAQASSMASAVQQVAVSLGVAVAAFVLKISMMARGATALANIDVVAAYLVIIAAMMLSAISFARLPANAGAEISGNR